MERLWAPWRMRYIDSSNVKGCFLCKYIKQRSDSRNLILHRGKEAFIILNRFPYNSGHLMVAPYSHISSLEALSDAENMDLMKLIVFSINLLKKAFAPQGFNIGLNLGRVAGAGLEDHIHFHVVPRWSGDTNFMPVSAGTKVVAQQLEETYKRLKKEIR